MTPPPRPLSARPAVVVLLGVSASGKTTVGRALAARLGWAFEDADDYHSAASREKMARGQGLTDADRAPWLAALAALVRASITSGPPTVLACSALKARYRDQIAGGRLGADGRPEVAFVWLDVPPGVLAERLRQRQGHVAGPALLPSQLAAFEPPADALQVDGTRPVAALAAEVAAALELSAV